MLGDAPNELYVASRTALLDVLEELGPHAEQCVLVGAQAIYLRCDQLPVAIAPFTKDADIAVVPPIGASPALEEAMARAGLHQARDPGIWLREAAQVDLLVPDSLAP